MPWKALAVTDERWIEICCVGRSETGNFVGVTTLTEISLCRRQECPGFENHEAWGSHFVATHAEVPPESAAQILSVCISPLATMCNRAAPNE